MPQAIGAAVIAALTATSAAAVGATAATLVGTTILSGVLIGAQLLLAEKPKVPEPADGKQTLKQALPPAIYGYGRDRNGGAYAAYKMKEGTSYDVYAFHQGEIDGYETFYLHDDAITFDTGQVDGGVNAADGVKYRRAEDDPTVRIFWRTGLPTETPYSQMVSALPNAWTPDHRGDGIASALLIVKTPSEKQFSKRLPFGLPRLSVVGRWQRCWDPRDPTQIESDKTTWKWTRNPFVCLLNFYCHSPAGYLRPVSRAYAPVAAYWRAAMDKCDEEVLRADGTVEPRYMIGGHFDAKTARSGVVGAMLRSCDGWLAERGDGAIVVYAGWYYDPAVVIDDHHIYDIDIRRGRMADERVTQLNVSLNSPDHNYGKVAADPWVNQAEIDAGARPVARDVEAEWCQSWTQSRRLAKIEFDKARCKVRGTMILRPYGENLRGRRFFILNYGRRASTRMIPCEIIDFHDEMFSNGSYRVEFQSVDPDRYAWTTAEEGRRPAIPDNSDDADELPVPPLPTLAVIRETIGGGAVAKISATSPPVEGWPDLSLTGWYRKVGTTAWRGMSAPDEDVLQVLSDPVEDGSYEVQTAYIGGGGSDGDRSPIQTIVVSADNVAPGAPTTPTATLSGTTGVVSVIANATVGDHTAALEFRGGPINTAPASLPILAVQPARPADPRTFLDTGLGVGAKDYAVYGLNGSGVRSTSPAGPVRLYVPGEAVNEAFPYADGALETVGVAKWLLLPGGTAGAVQVVSGRVSIPVATTGYYVTTDLRSDKSYIEFEWRATAGSNTAVGWLIDGNTFAICRFTSGGNWQCVTKLGASASNVQSISVAGTLPAVGAIIRIEKVGTAITIKVNSTIVASGSIPAALQFASLPGLIANQAIGVFLDNLKAGVQA